MPRCTHVTVAAIANYFGDRTSSEVCAARGTSGFDVVHALRQLGYRVEPDMCTWKMPFEARARRTPTIHDFVTEHPRGVYYVMGPRHAMALVEGHLVDTAERSVRGLKRVKYDGHFSVRR